MNRTTANNINAAEHHVQRERVPRRRSTIEVLRSSGQMSVSSAAIWGCSTAEMKSLMEEYKFQFSQYDTENTGVLDVDAIYSIIQDALGAKDGPAPLKISTILRLVKAFSADNQAIALNLSEFAAMMKYMGQSVETFDDGQMMDPNIQVSAAIKMHERAQRAITTRLIQKLLPLNGILTMKDVELDDVDLPNPYDTDFESAFGPSEMRCLALVSHNGMKDTMMKFVKFNKNVLKKFRLTGTNSTMTMLKQVFSGDESVVFGPVCKSGPLGGDGQLVSLLCEEQLGGVIFFQDPLDAHAHTSCIESLVRNLKIHNIMHATTTVSALMMMHSLRSGLEHGRPELIPSFFITLQCPSVARYQKGQAKVIAKSVASTSDLSCLPSHVSVSDMALEESSREF